MQRWIIEISEYAVVDYPETWGEWRNPVKYTTLEELGIDLKAAEVQADADAHQGPATACRRPSDPKLEP